MPVASTAKYSLATPDEARDILEIETRSVKGQKWSGAREGELKSWVFAHVAGAITPLVESQRPIDSGLETRIGEAIRGAGAPALTAWRYRCAAKVLQPEIPVTDRIRLRCHHNRVSHPAGRRRYTRESAPIHDAPSARRAEYTKMEWRLV